MSGFCAALLGGFDSVTVAATLRLLGLGMLGILATAVLFMLLTVVLRRAFPPAREPGDTGRS